jgi:hypothetical protein
MAHGLGLKAQILGNVWRWPKNRAHGALAAIRRSAVRIVNTLGLSLGLTSSQLNGIETGAWGCHRTE